MKIRNLIEALFNTEVKPDQRYHGQLRQDDARTSSSAFSKVKDVRDDPHMVRKYNHRPLDTKGRSLYSVDGFNFFIEQLIEMGETDNIHFPRVYSMKKIVDDKDKHIHTYNVEKLLPSKVLSRDELLKVCEELFGADDDASEYRRNELEDIIAGKILYALQHHDYDDIKSESLLEALQILNNISKKAYKLQRGHKIDIHIQNVMYRRTPVGVQLVINDPIA